jgi:hypothetical protein
VRDAGARLSPLLQLTRRYGRARWIVVFGAPLLAYVDSLLHPRQLYLGEDPWFFIGVHLAFTPILCLLAWMIVLLVDGVEGRPATAARLLAVPFAVAYTLFTAFDGVAIGAFVWKADALAPPQQQTAGNLIHSVSHSELERPLFLVASLFWFAAVMAVIVTLWRRAPRPALVLLGLGAAAFARSHVRPWGPAGMAAVLAGVVWLELRPRHAAEPRAKKS